MELAQQSSTTRPAPILRDDSPFGLGGHSCMRWRAAQGGGSRCGLSRRASCALLAASIMTRVLVLGRAPLWRHLSEFDWRCLLHPGTRPRKPGPCSRDAAFARAPPVRPRPGFLTHHLPTNIRAHAHVHAHAHAHVHAHACACACACDMHMHMHVHVTCTCTCTSPTRYGWTRAR